MDTGGTPYEDGGKDWNSTAASQGLTATNRSEEESGFHSESQKEQRSMALPTP